MSNEDIIWVIIAIAFVGLCLWLYAKSTIFKHLFFIYYANKHGESNYFLIGILRDRIIEMLKEDNINITHEDLDIVHEMGHRYRGLLRYKGEQYDMEIIADSAGNIQYRIT